MKLYTLRDSARYGLYAFLVLFFLFMLHFDRFASLSLALLAAVFIAVTEARGPDVRQR